jgi:hypothetical protein
MPGCSVQAADQFACAVSGLARAIIKQSLNAYYVKRGLQLLPHAGRRFNPYGEAAPWS